MLDWTTAKLQKAMPEHVVVESWKEIAPELKLSADSVDVVNTVVLGIILFALLFGLVDTLLMSVLDRVRDFGVLLAVGMYRRRLFSMIIFESLMLSFTGALAGVVIGGGITLYFQIHGVNLSIFSAALSSYGIPSLLYPYITPSTYGTLAVMMMFTSVIAALYPAMKAVRLKPVEAMRTIG
jgi:ABC-type lipoprotein release transport system permease subunit